MLATGEAQFKRQRFGDNLFDRYLGLISMGRLPMVRAADTFAKFQQKRTSIIPLGGTGGLACFSSI